MKLIDPYVKLISEPNPYKLVEKIGRTCYKSESNITDSSCYKFVDRLINRQHFAMLEHARFTFLLYNYEQYYDLFNIPGLILQPINSELTDWILNVSMSHLYNPKWETAKYLFSTLRGIIESVYVSNNDAICKDKYIWTNNNRNSAYSIQCDKIVYTTDYAEILNDTHLIDPKLFKFCTIKFITDRGTSHELVRHRCAIAQESTRYCDYTKEKFGAELQFIKPLEYSVWDKLLRQEFDNAMKTSESQYQWLITKGKLTPQIARQWLPHALKTEVVLTMNFDQWDHFFNLRYFGKTGSPHPEMRRVAEYAFDIYKNL